MTNQNNKKTLNLLLVEDNPADVRLTEEAFKDSNIDPTIYVAEDGEKAIRFLNQQGEFVDSPKPDLILLDLNIPKIDGKEVLKYIKTNDKLKIIPTVVLTTSKSTDDIFMSYNYSANCFITKPVDYYEFIKIIKTIEDFWLSNKTLPSF